MNQQDLVWVKLPFSDLRQSKVRPSLVVSNNSYNKSNPDIVVCAVTSKLKESKYSVPIDNKDLSSGNLPIKSRVRADKILQIEKELVIRQFAKLENKTFDKVVSKVADLVKRS
jgi:mRNA interferase MazF